MNMPKRSSPFSVTWVQTWTQCCRNTNDLFLNQIVTCDKMWILYDNCKRSGQTLPKAKIAPAKAFGENFVVCNQYYPLQPFGNKSEHYCNQFSEVHFSLQNKKLALVNQCDLILLHDNARPHLARLTLQIIIFLST